MLVIFYSCDITSLYQLEIFTAEVSKEAFCLVATGKMNNLTLSSFDSKIPFVSYDENELL